VTFAKEFLLQAASILAALDCDAIDAVAAGLAKVRDDGGRVFCLGVGGSAATASHMVNDLRKACGVEAYAPTDNVSELTARTNDDGWEATFVEWLKTSALGNRDALLIFSVGGGRGQVSRNIVLALEWADRQGADIFGVVGRDGGATKEMANACVLIPPLVPSLITPLTEGVASVVAHALVAHPLLRRP
jgi:D-sedoheptulose 7-phosphate isomerase